MAAAAGKNETNDIAATAIEAPILDADFRKSGMCD